MKRLNIRTKIIASTVLIVTASLFVSGFFTHDYVTGIIRDQSVRDSRTQLAQIAAQLEMVQDQVMKTAEYIISDEGINAVIKQPDETEVDDEVQAYFRKLNVQEDLKHFTALNAFILNAMIVREDGEIYSNHSGYEPYFVDYLQQSWFTDVIESGRRTAFSVPHDFFYLNRYQPVVSYIVAYRNLLDDDSPLYYLVLDVNYGELTGAFTQSIGDFEHLLLTNEAGEVLFDSLIESTSGYSDVVQQAIEHGLPYEDGQHIVLINKTDTGNWTQIGVISKEKLFAKIDTMLHVLLLIVASSIVVIFIILLPIILNITRPISKLVQAMKRVSAGALHTRINIRSSDEMEVLANGFNQMVDELQQYVQASIQHEEMKRTMQISLLMSQINPHFIYNTLNTVIYLSYDERNRDVVRITESLIGILQDTIRTGEGEFFATLLQERKIVEQYIEIQHHRYPDRFLVEWNIPQELEQAMIPRMVIQPLVENALFHGIIPQDREGRIRITAQRVGERLRLEVADDGVGMDEHTMEHALHMPQSGKHADQIRGIGLTNIQERLVFHYGQPFGLTIVSAPASGTKISMMIPLSWPDERATGY